MPTCSQQYGLVPLPSAPVQLAERGERLLLVGHKTRDGLPPMPQVTIMQHACQSVEKQLHRAVSHVAAAGVDDHRLAPPPAPCICSCL